MDSSVVELGAWEDAFSDAFKIVSGAVNLGQPTVYSVVRDEMFFLPAFLNHYRSIGVEQFLFFDDQSQDGSRQYLAAQPDCVVISSEIKYGDVVELLPVPGYSVRSGKKRFGVLLKSLIPRVFLKEGYAIYADADEFLVLPEPFESVSELFAALEKNRISVVAASLVEMYPESLADLAEEAGQPETLHDLLALAPFFDAKVLLELSPGSQARTEYRGASWRLFNHYGISRRHWINRHAPALIVKALGLGNPSTACVKTPVICWGGGVCLEGSHRANKPPGEAILLALMHFKFTPDLWRRMGFALKSGAYAGGSKAYRYYDALFRRMAREDGLFLGEVSVRYEGLEAYSNAGLIFNNLGSDR
ncbi:glycosyltransferase family 2 protein [Ectothiorhodospira variabilis]|uniref:glycosyltransferase family 2 protein n=1 Tax=Ectothiorhodospira variabilis TaxID=505694 RepID=UPI001EFBE004|nr:glycosyltransferase family 2 protein [Ectothiorhodospira variabilis]MCG5493461.1 glycosyltransferase family 2 protein [Ectothiorhodospira variabilis]MCG5496807.1 glycosyltransferase family 2 protein [Ectothiorhodospira variabilis]MCG5502790.1 glycosyltransferase family 2 protein [Ectothiorhodospira variabilis]MCG5506422.1 glycosyltransferase family 2 protein [Ectothiorhodospira variabilis]